MLAHIHFKELKIAWITLVMIFLLTRSKKDFDFVIEKIDFFLSTGWLVISGSELDFGWILWKKNKENKGVPRCTYIMIGDHSLRISFRTSAASEAVAERSTVISCRSSTTNPEYKLLFFNDKLHQKFLDFFTLTCHYWSLVFKWGGGIFQNVSANLHLLRNNSQCAAQMLQLKMIRLLFGWVAILIVLHF